jgi:tRNA (guanine-N7-)-methyltransferase
MVNEEMVETIVKRLVPDGRVFIQTDIEFLADEMFDLLKRNQCFHEELISENPFLMKTEREKAVEEKGLKVHRRMFRFINPKP